jgi:glutathione S-transferase
MVTVLGNDPAGLVEEKPALAAYCARGRARPAYRRALDGQLGDFSEIVPMEQMLAQQ